MRGPLARTGGPSYTDPCRVFVEVAPRRTNPGRGRLSSLPFDSRPPPSLAEGRLLCAHVSGTEVVSFGACYFPGLFRFRCDDGTLTKSADLIERKGVAMKTRLIRSWLVCFSLMAMSVLAATLTRTLEMRRLNIFPMMCGVAVPLGRSRMIAILKLSLLSLLILASVPNPVLADTLYGANSYGSLYTIDKTNAASTMVGLGGIYNFASIAFDPVPEPPTVALLGAGAVALLFYAWRRLRRAV